MPFFGKNVGNFHLSHGIRRSLGEKFMFPWQHCLFISKILKYCKGLVQSDDQLTFGFETNRWSI